MGITFIHAAMQNPLPTIRSLLEAPQCADVSKTCLLLSLVPIVPKRSAVLTPHFLLVVMDFWKLILCRDRSTLNTRLATDTNTLRNLLLRTSKSILLPVN